MSNDIGTHIGYCIALSKPHYLYKQKIVIDNICVPLEAITRNRKISIERDKEYNSITRAFNKFSFEITKEQRTLVNYYWGIGVENGVQI